MSERFKILKKEGSAKRGRFETVHGVIETPVFMNVGTVAAIKGAVSTEDLERIGTQVELSNTYHLHVRPGDDKINALFFNLPQRSKGKNLKSAGVGKNRFIP